MKITVAVATFLCAGAALAAPTPQQICDSERLMAWRNYDSCVNKVRAKEAKQVAGSSYDVIKNLWKCNHKYFREWESFQSRAILAGTTCVGSRFSDNGDQTVTDNLSGLVWEKKDDAGGVHDKDAVWGVTPSGTAFSMFFADAGTGLNVTGFAGAKDWRLPTLAELQTIMLDYSCSGESGSPTCTCAGPCVDPALDAANTKSGTYWSHTLRDVDSGYLWYVSFLNGFIHFNPPGNAYVRAVRGGLD